MDIVQVQNAAGHRVGVMGPLLLVVAEAPPTLESAELIDLEQRKLISAHGFFAMVIFSLASPKAPGPEALDRIRRTEEATEGKSRGTVVAVMNRGIAGSIIRAFTAALSLVTSSKLVLVKNVEEAAERVRAMTLPPEITDDPRLAERFNVFVGGT